MASSLIWEEKDGFVNTGNSFFFLVINFSSSHSSRILNVYTELNLYDPSVVFLPSSLISI